MAIGSPTLKPCQLPDQARSSSWGSTEADRAAALDEGTAPKLAISNNT